MLTTILILVVIAGFWFVGRRLAEVARTNMLVVEEIRSLRLKSRARISTASTQSGAVTEEQELVRLGRQTVGIRKVVGGDAESQQFESLGKTLAHYGVKPLGTEEGGEN